MRMHKVFTGLLAPVALACAVLAADGDWSGATMQPVVEDDEKAGAVLPPSSPGTAAYQFSRVPGPAKAQGARVFGAYNRGCLAGGVPLAAESPDWQIMRPSRNRAWGHPDLVTMVGEIAADARKAGWPGLLIGDLAQARGGPMPYGHASHQIGLDVDIWLTPMPRERLSADGLEQFQPPSMINMNTDGVKPELFGPLQIALIKIAAEHPQTARVFVNARIKNALCQGLAPENRGWLNRVRPAPGHDAHLHIRMHCPQGETFCKAQKDPEPGDGCGELASWIRPPPPPPKVPPAPTAPRGNQLRMTALPDACRQVLVAP
jgi:penicillin-insensitive murein DD-endopeptidase